MTSFKNIISKFFLLLIFLVNACCYCFSQDEKQLLQLIATTKNDSIKVETYLQISSQYNDKPNEALPYVFKAKEIADKINKASLQANCNYYAAVYCDMLKSPDKALYYYKEAITILQKIKDSVFLADTYSDMAITYREKDVLDSCLYFNIKSLELRQALHLKDGVAANYNNIALVYRKKNDWNNAIASYKKASNIFIGLNDNKHLCVVYRNIGMMYKNKKEFDSVFIYFNRAIPIAQKINDSNSINIIQLNTALCFNDLKRYYEALIILNKLNKNESFKANDEYPLLMYGLGVANVGIRNFDDGIKYLLTALNTPYSRSNFEFKGSVNLSLSEAYQANNNFSKAFEHYKAFKVYSDSLYTEKNTQNVNELSTQYKTKEKEQEIVLLNKENELKDLSIKEKKRTLLLYAFGLIFVTILAGAALLLYRNKRNFSNQLEDKNKIISVSLKEKEVLLKEIHHRVKNNLQVISSLLSLQSKNISDEKALLALNEGRNRVKSMALIHQNLYRDDNLMGVDVKDYIEKLIESLFASYNIKANSIKLSTEIDAIQLDVDTIIPIGLILNELISNALKYAFENKEDGLLQVCLKLQDDKLLLGVRDNGKGIENVDILGKSTSMGYKLVQSFLQKLNATMKIENQDGTNIELLISKYKLV